MKKENQKMHNIKNMALILLVLAGILIMVEIFGIGRKADSMIEIPEGAGVLQIAQILKENQYIGNERMFQIYSIMTGRTYYSGSYYIEKAGYQNIAETLSVPATEQAIRLVFREGIEVREIKDKLVEVGLCTAEEFDGACDVGLYSYPFLTDATNLEGYLFPDTYDFSYKEGAQSIMNKMLANFQAKAYDVYAHEAEFMGLRWHDVVIMASILEREVASGHELKTVSGIFYNRLQKKGESRGYLESCATVQYILKERKALLSVEDTKIDSPYNTYLYPGLPVAPISSPGAPAIEAAIHPAKSSYLYFVSDGNGRHYFAETFEEHKQNMRKAEN